MSKLKFMFVIFAVLLSSCNILKLSQSESGEDLIKTQVAGTLSAYQTSTALVEAAKQEALKEVALTLTAAAGSEVVEMATEVPVLPTEAEVPTEEFTATPIPPTETPEPTEIPPTETPKASPTPCFVVVDDWCLAHQGCATMDIKNGTDSLATVRIADKRNGTGNVNATLKVIAGGMCSFMLRPARYWYEFNYCGEYSEGYHALNDRWWIKFTCP